jgi:hypothetical protein
MNFKDETLNLQGIGTFSKIHIHSKIHLKKNHLPRQLYAFIITICKNNCSKIHLYEKIIFGQKDL